MTRDWLMGSIKSFTQESESRRTYVWTGHWSLVEIMTYAFETCSVFEIQSFGDHFISGRFINYSFSILTKTTVIKR
jgi:hypothetical protein